MIFTYQILRPLKLTHHTRRCVCFYPRAFNVMPQIDRLLVLLRVAKEVSAEIPVPGLSSALALALHVAEKAKVCLSRSCRSRRHT